MRKKREIGEKEGRKERERGEIGERGGRRKREKGRKRRLKREIEKR